MSIIHEALKKVNHPITNPDRKAVRPEVELHRRKASGGWGPLFLLLVCFLAAGPVLVPLLFKSSTASRGEGGPAHSQFAIEEAPLPVAPPPAPRTMPALRTTRPGTYRLTGVVFSTAESYCLINGLVLKLGEKIGDAVVESISQEAVTLALNGQKLTLTVE